MTPSTAYIDMEFAGIYGTRQGIQIPIEIGVVIYSPQTDTVSFTGKTFSLDINVEHWKNVTNDLGKRINGHRRVFNLIAPGRSKNFDAKFHLDPQERNRAHHAIAIVHKDLREFMRSLNHYDIGTLVFFARQREMETFKNSGVKTEEFLIRDLQNEIKTRFHLEEHISLDRMSLVTDFRIVKSSAVSTHFFYTIPEKFLYRVKPHKAIGDAARMFLVDQEFLRFPEEFGERLKDHLSHYEKRKQAEFATRNGESGASQPQTM
jgi:hypothetical protein